MKMAHHILLRPLITERTTAKAEATNTVAFVVARTANKVEIRRAVEDLFGVKVDRVRTLVVSGKSKRWGRWEGRTRAWKKAYVTLADGSSINFFEGV